MWTQPHPEAGLSPHQGAQAHSTPFVSSDWKVCSQRTCFIKHQDICTGEKPQWLVVHQRTHPGGRAHECTECGKALLTGFALLNIRKYTQGGSMQTQQRWKNPSAESQLFTYKRNAVHLVIVHMASVIPQTSLNITGLPANRNFGPIGTASCLVEASCT